MMLALRGISKSFDGVQAVMDVSFLVGNGEITSLIGPNGAGKTTLFNIATGFLAADKGDVRFNEFPLNNLDPWQIAQLGIRRTFQNLRLFRQMTVLENVLLGIKGQRGEQLLNALFHFSRNSADHARNIKRADELIDLAELSAHRNEPADNLSYGQQKLLSIACCLAGDPQLLLLDEPVAGVQQAMISTIERFITMLVHERKRTVFLIEHDIDFVLRISDKVIVMDEGKKIVEDGPVAIRTNSQVLEAYLS